LERRSLKKKEKNRASTGFESRSDVFQASSFQLLKLEIYCDDHSGFTFSYPEPQYTYELFHIYFTSVKKAMIVAKDANFGLAS